MGGPYEQRQQPRGAVRDERVHGGRPQDHGVDAFCNVRARRHALQRARGQPQQARKQRGGGARLVASDGVLAEHRAHDLGLANSTAEEQARSDPYCQRSASADLLRDVRLAGGWARYALQPHYDLLVLRALCHRRRATFDSWTPEVLVRLFGAPEARRRNNAVRGRTDLPDPLFWRVLEFSLGTAYDYPWVRQRVRARRAAAVAAAE